MSTLIRIGVIFAMVAGVAVLIVHDLMALDGMAMQANSPSPASGTMDAGALVKAATASR